MAARKVIQAGHPNLKKTNKEIKKFKSKVLKKLIKDLRDTMYKTGLIGIASPQIAKNYSVFVTHPRTTKARKLGKIDKLRVYINPKITFKSKAESIIYEGCGSVTDGAIFGPVSRPKGITVEALDEIEQKFRLTCDGILARVIQHEIDHLNGIEFLERVNDYSKIIAESYYRKTIRNSRMQKQEVKITKIDYKLID
ncbi:MAG: Peptide deformylase [Microgenomates group bacterium GW2011_GWA2_37_6]|nr:MAG: Peptide deformylase [Microgenomates group bacterium GW2011_GWA2_37_6]